MRFDNLSVGIDEAAKGMRDFTVAIDQLRNEVWLILEVKHTRHPRPKRRRRVNGRLVPLRNRPGKSGRMRRRR